MQGDRTIERGERAAQIDNCLNLLRRQLAQSDPQVFDAELKVLRDALKKAPAPRASAKSELARSLSGGRAYSPAQTALLELRAARQAFAHRREQLSGALSTAQAASLLGASRQTPHDRAARNTLLAIADQGRLHFPAWQFDPDGPNGVVAGLPDALRALEASPLGKARWLTSANPYLEGRTPLQALRDGDLNRVVDQARAVGAL